MMRWSLVVIIFMLFSCEGAVEKPKNLVSKSEMATIIKEFTLNDQAPILNASANLTEGTRYILKQHNVSAQDFMDSYKYYLVKNKMDGILEEAQNQLVEEEPRLKQNAVQTTDTQLK